MRLKRMLTSEFKNDRKKMNDSQSTFMGNNQSFRQQIDCLSGLQVNGLERQATRRKKSKMSFDQDEKGLLRVSPRGSQANLMITPRG